jgi:hypothetical protein
MDDLMNRNQGIACVLSVVMIVLLAGTVTADDKKKCNAKAEANVKALVEKGVVMAVVEGEEAALKAIGDPKGPFIKDDLYLFAGPLNKVTMSAHPYNPELVGKDLSTSRDKRGNFLFFKFVKISLKDGAGWTEYWWPKPGAKEASRKLTYIMKVPGKDMYIGGGYYTERESKKKKKKKEK